MRIKSLFFCLIFCLLPAAANSLYASESLSDGSKVIVYGDGTLSEIVKFTKKELKDELKKKKIKIEEKGKKGSSVADLIEKLDKDVIGKKPDLVILTVPLGDLYDAKKKVLKEGVQIGLLFTGMKSMVEKIQQAGVSVAVATPCLAGEDLSSGKDVHAVLDELAGKIREYCKQGDITCCDYRKVAVNYLTKNNSKNKAKGILSKNGVQISKNGAEVLAGEFKKCLGMSAGGIDGPLVESDRVVFFKGNGSQWAGSHFGIMRKHIQERIAAQFSNSKAILIPKYSILKMGDSMFQNSDHSAKILSQKSRVSFIQLIHRGYNGEAFSDKYELMSKKIIKLCAKLSQHPNAQNIFLLNEPLVDLDPKDSLHGALTRINDLLQQCANDNGLQVFDLNELIEDARLEKPDFTLWRAPKSPYYSHEFLALIENKICEIIGVAE